jgi:Calcineurin-like phosphoesterase
MIVRTFAFALLAVVLVTACTQWRESSEKSGVSFPRLKPLPGTGSLRKTGDPSRFRFVVFGDAMETPQPTTTIRTIFRNIGEMTPRPAFALSLGDIIQGEPTEPIDIPKISGNLENFLSVARTGRVPVFNAPGNHELDDVDDIPSTRMLQIYEQVIGPAYGFFDYGDSHFIALNSSEVPPPGTKAPPKPARGQMDQEFSYIGSRQIAQLKADLEANRNKAHVFVAMHYPLKALTADDRLYPERTARELVELFGKYPNVSYVLAAHEHLYYNPQDPSNLIEAPSYAAGQPARYLVSGGGGAPIWVKPEKGGFHHYLIFQVDGPSVSVVLKRLP